MNNNLLIFPLNPKQILQNLEEMVLNKKVLELENFQEAIVDVVEMEPWIQTEVAKQISKNQI